MVTSVFSLTTAVLTTKAAELLPNGIVTVSGFGDAAVLLLFSVTLTPPAAAGAAMRTTPPTDEPPTTDEAPSSTDVTVFGRTVRRCSQTLAPRVALITVFSGVFVALAVMSKLTRSLPFGTVTLEGIVAAAELLL